MIDVVDGDHVSLLDTHAFTDFKTACLGEFSLQDLRSKIQDVYRVFGFCLDVLVLVLDDLTWVPGILVSRLWYGMIFYGTIRRQGPGLI